MKIHLFSILILCSVVTIAQEQSTYRPIVGLTYANGQSELFRFQSLDGGGSHDSENFYSTGVMFLLPGKKSTNLEIGIEYSRHQNLSFEPPFNPDRNDTTIFGSKSVIAIPILTRIHFWKYCFANPGIVLTYDDTERYSNFDNQTGVGINLGLGFQYEFDFGISLFVNPYMRFYSTISFVETNPDHLSEAGFRFGLGYRL